MWNVFCEYEIPFYVTGWRNIKLLSQSLWKRKNIFHTNLFFFHVTDVTIIPVSFSVWKKKQLLKSMFMKGLRFFFLLVERTNGSESCSISFCLKTSFPLSSGTSLGSTCKHAIATCPGGKTTYPVTCSLGCPKDYSIKGSSTVTCQTSGQWSSYATSYCQRNNDPPTQVRANDEHLISLYNVIVVLSR